MSGRVLVTGGLGFIGSAYVRALADDGIAVLNVDLDTYAGDERRLAGVGRVETVRMDVAGPGFSDLVARERPPLVVHFAAETHVTRSEGAAGAFFHANVEGTRGVLDAALAAGVPRVVHMSTDEVYGSLSETDAPFCETTGYAPNSPYAASKAASDHLVRAYFHTYGLPVLTTNCSNNYGPFQFPEKLIPLVILNALKGETLPIYGDGKNVRDWLFVGDHCAAILRVLHDGRPGETYNIGGRSEQRNIDVVRTICAILDELCPDSQFKPHENLIRFVTDRPGHDRRYAIDPRKIEHELQWQPQETFESGIRKTVAWYLNNQPWVQDVTSGSYRDWIDTQYAQRSAAGASEVKR